MSDSFTAAVPNTSILGGFFLTVIIYTTIVLLHVLLGGRSVVGYACTDTPNKHDILLYKLNGVKCMVVGIAAVLLVLHVNQCFAKWELLALSPRTILIFIAQRQLGLLLGSQVTATLAAYYFYQRGLEWNAIHHASSTSSTSSTAHNHHQQQQQHAVRAMSKDDVRRRSTYRQPRSINTPQRWYIDFYNGIGEFNPRSTIPRCFVPKEHHGTHHLMYMDWKYCLFLCRTIMTQIMVLASCAAASNGTIISHAMCLTVGLWTFVSLDFLLYEHSFLYSYTVVAERMGFKLLWSVMGVHPFLYNIGIRELLKHETAENDITDDLSLTAVTLIVVLFLIGWMISRGAQYQKHMIKTQPSRSHILCGLLEQRCLHSHRDNDAPRQLLISGFWGLSKHVNYFGDMLQAIALGLPAMIVTSSSYLAFIYPAWVIWNAILQQRKDDAMCRMRYGNQAWDDYSEVVPYRIIPHVY